MWPNLAKRSSKSSVDMLKSRFLRTRRPARSARFSSWRLRAPFETGLAREAQFWNSGRFVRLNTFMRGCGRRFVFRKILSLIGSSMRMKTSGARTVLWNSGEIDDWIPYSEYVPLIGWHVCLIKVLVCDWLKRKQNLGRWLAVTNWQVLRLFS